MSGSQTASCICLFMLAAPTATATDAGPSEPRQAIARYDIAWAARDGATLEALVAPGFVYFTSRGGEWSRTRWFDFMMSPAYTLEKAERTEIVVNPAGDVAVASTRWTGNGSFEGRPFNDDQRCSITLVRQAGNWRILSEHCTQIAPRTD